MIQEGRDRAERIRKERQGGEQLVVAAIASRVAASSGSRLVVLVLWLQTRKSDGESFICTEGNVHSLEATTVASKHPSACCRLCGVH